MLIEKWDRFSPVRTRLTTEHTERMQNFVISHKQRLRWRKISPLLTRYVGFPSDGKKSQGWLNIGMMFASGSEDASSADMLCSFLFKY